MQYTSNGHREINIQLKNLLNSIIQIHALIPDP